MARHRLALYSSLTIPATLLLLGSGLSFLTAVTSLAYLMPLPLYGSGRLFILPSAQTSHLLFIRAFDDDLVRRGHLDGNTLNSSTIT
jgi:hypothetical protein